MDCLPPFGLQFFPGCNTVVYSFCRKLQDNLSWTKPTIDFSFQMDLAYIQEAIYRFFIMFVLNQVYFA